MYFEGASLHELNTTEKLKNNSSFNFILCDIDLGVKLRK